MSQSIDKKRVYEDFVAGRLKYWQAVHLLAVEYGRIEAQRMVDKWVDEMPTLDGGTGERQ